MTLNQLIYKTSRPLGGLRIARFLARKHPRILMYHRLSAGDEPGKIRVDQFRSQMKLIKQFFHPMSLSQLIEASAGNRVPDHAVVVTFDDGYADFADYAFPVMQEEGIPATLFLTTGFVNGDLWLWPDQIRYVIEHAKPSDAISIEGLATSIDIRNAPGQSWHQIADYCLTIPNRDKLALIDSLFERLNVRKPALAPEEYRALTWDQIDSMAARGLDVGSHSNSHPILTCLDESSLLKELALSRQLILEHLGIDTRVFCYPNGQPLDFNADVKAAVRKEGYQVGVAAYPGRSPLADQWAIKRYPANKATDIFEKNLFGLTYLSLSDKARI